MKQQEITAFQRLGNIPVREGRLLAFPNTLEMRSLYSLKDQSEPGRCKILTLSLVDPHMRILSTANVPPQQMEWWTPRQRLINVFLQSKLPQELVDMVQNYLVELRDGPMSPEEHSSLMDDFKASRRAGETNQRKNFGLPPTHNWWRDWCEPDGEGTWVF
jgi:hypothetical protein